MSSEATAGALSLEALQHALGLQMELTAIVTRGGGVDRLLHGWQQRTGEGVAVFDRLGRPLGRSSAFPPDALSAIGEMLFSGAPRLGESLRVPHPGETDPVQEIRITSFAGNDTVRGYLARVPSGEESAELTEPALRSLLALEYERHWLLDEPARRQRAQQLGRVLELGDAGGAQAYLRGIGVDADELRGIAIEARDETHAEVLVDDLAAILTTTLIRHRARVVECLAPFDPRQTLAEYGLEVPLGVGTPVAPKYAARSMRQAALALETSRRVGTPIEYLDGASHEFLMRVAPPAYLEAFSAATLDPIARARGGEELLRTLHTWLVERRSIEATAERMGVHRHTVRNRIQRIAQLTGHDLDGIDAQTQLWLALKARGLGNDTRSPA
ncbi:PucR family transcriptional regulator [Leucobacter sp.]